jgi:hypothetical protein
VSAVPATIDALLALFGAAPALAGVRIVDGPWLEEPTETDVVVLGWLPDGSPAVDFQQTPLTMGTSQEVFVVHGFVYSWSGGTDSRAVRVRADVLLEAVRGVLLANKALGGVVSYAQLTQCSWLPSSGSVGTAQMITYAIHVDAFTTP